MELKNRSFQYGKYRFSTFASMPHLEARRGRYQPSSCVLGPLSQNLSWCRSPCRCFDQNITDRAVRQWRVRLRMCPCKRRPLWAQTVTDVFVYELLRRLFHIGNFCFWVLFLKQLLFRNCVVDFGEICNVYVIQMIIKAAKRIFNSDKICRSYSDLNFGVTFLEHSV